MKEEAMFVLELTDFPLTKYSSETKNRRRKKGITAANINALMTGTKRQNKERSERILKASCKNCSQ